MADMKMNFGSESGIRQLGNNCLNSIMDIWHEEVKNKLNRDMNVLVGNRRAHPGLSAYKGLNSQITVSNLDRRACLVVWYDPYEILYEELLNELGYGEELMNRIGSMLEAGISLGPEYEPADNLERLNWDDILRRIGFWILKVRGYKRIANREKKYAELESIISTECSVPPLNSILKDVSYDFETGLVSLVDDTLAGMDAMDCEPPRRMDRAVNALRLWNLMEVCSEDDRKRIETVLTESFPRIGEAIVKTGEIAGKSDILTPEGNLEFNWNFIKENRLPGDWEAVDEMIDMLKAL